MTNDIAAQDSGYAQLTLDDFSPAALPESEQAPADPAKPRFLYVSDLTRIYRDKETGENRLAQATITDAHAFASFDELSQHVLVDLRYPRPQSHKFETYGWTPTLFHQSVRTLKNGEMEEGSWWRGVAELDELFAWYCDVDNADASRPMVTPDEVVRRLCGSFGHCIRCFVYTTFSHTVARPKFRLVVHISRYIKRAEAVRVFAHLDHTVLGHQADPSIYDSGDYLYAPPHECETTQHGGEPLPIDEVLARETEMRAHHPELHDRYLHAQPKAVRPKKERTSEQQVAHDARQVEITARRADSRVRDGFLGIEDPDICNPAWVTLYSDAPACRHYTTFRCIVAKIHLKTRGTLSRGEMALVIEQIDAAGGHYMRDHYPDHRSKWDDWLDNFLPKIEIEDDEDNFEPLLDREDSGLVIDYCEGECGEGKTRDRLLRIAREGGRHVYVVDKVENIQRRKDEFCRYAGPKAAMRFRFYEAHSRTGSQGLRVGLQLRDHLGAIRKLRAGQPCIVFVTQEGAAQADWTGWEDFEITYDEVPEGFHIFHLDAGEHAGLLLSRVEAVEEDGNCHRLALTELGREVIEHGPKVDAYEAVHYGLLMMLSKPNNRVWVKKAGWDDPQNSRLEFFGLLSPLSLRPFRRVWMLGDSLTSSTIARIWREKWGVEFRPVEFERRRRRVPTSQRVHIHHFVDHRDASFTRFAEGDMPLGAVAEWIREHSRPHPVLWTANEHVKSQADTALSLEDWQPPKSHGRNDLQHYRRVAWLAAMKPSKFEVGALREVCGMTAQELIDWREFNVMYQFVMRCELRDFDASSEIDIYVFSRRQAEYLHRRLGGVLHHHQGVVADCPRSIDAGGAMTGGERMAVMRWRLKMEKAGVSDVRKLPGAEALSTRMCSLINVTAKRKKG
jgi:hypothetical protein